MICKGDMFMNNENQNKSEINIERIKADPKLSPIQMALIRMLHETNILKDPRFLDRCTIRKEKNK
jgi:hypothetical protein